MYFMKQIINIILTLITVSSSIYIYRKQKKDEKNTALKQKKLERYEIFMNSLPGLYEGLYSSEEGIKMKKEFILNFYRIHLSCSVEGINKIRKLLESVKVGSNQTLSIDEMDKLIVSIINFFRRDLDLPERDEIEKFSHYGWSKLPEKSH